MRIVEAMALAPPRPLRGPSSSREEGKTTPALRATPPQGRRGNALDPQRFGRQVFPPVGLEIDAVGRLDLLLLPDRFLRDAREARFGFGGQGLAPQRLRVLQGPREPEAGVGIFVPLAHLGEDARRGP